MYELAWQGEGQIESEEGFMMGLSNLKNLGYDVKRSGLNELLSGLSREQVAPKSDNGHNIEIPIQTNENKPLDEPSLQSSEKVLINGRNNQASCRSLTVAQGSLS
jgi:hypothetical protein